MKELTHDDFMAAVKGRNPNEPEFHQAVSEVVETLIPFVNKHKSIVTKEFLKD